MHTGLEGERFQN